MTLLHVQYISHVSTPARSSSGFAIVLAMVTLLALVTAALLLVKDLRRLRNRQGATLVTEAEQWLREQYPP